MRRFRTWRALAVLVAALVATPIEAALDASDAAAQVWKPRSKQRKSTAGPAIKAPRAGKANAKSPPKKSRKASSKAKPARTKGPSKATRPEKKHPRKVRRTPARDEDDFTIIEEDFPDDD